MRFFFAFLKSNLDSIRCPIIFFFKIAGKADEPTFKRKLSKREKKELKKAEKAAKAAEKMNGDKDKDEGVAEKLYTGKNFALFEREKNYD